MPSTSIYHPSNFHFDPETDSSAILKVGKSSCLPSTWIMVAAIHVVMSHSEFSWPRALDRQIQAGNWMEILGNTTGGMVCLEEMCGKWCPHLITADKKLAKCLTRNAISYHQDMRITDDRFTLKILPMAKTGLPGSTCTRRAKSCSGHQRASQIALLCHFTLW